MSLNEIIKSCATGTNIRSKKGKNKVDPITERLASLLNALEKDSRTLLLTKNKKCVNTLSNNEFAIFLCTRIGAPLPTNSRYNALSEGAKCVSPFNAIDHAPKTATSMYNHVHNSIRDRVSAYLSRHGLHTDVETTLLHRDNKQSFRTDIVIRGKDTEIHLDVTVINPAAEANYKQTFSDKDGKSIKRKLLVSDLEYRDLYYNIDSVTPLTTALGQRKRIHQKEYGKTKKYANAIDVEGKEKDIVTHFFPIVVSHHSLLGYDITRCVTAINILLKKQGADTIDTLHFKSSILKFMYHALAEIRFFGYTNSKNRIKRK